MDWLYAVSGFGVGLLVGLTGMGGGSLMTPLLILLFGIAPASAVGTDLLFACITKMGGSFVHHRKGNVDWNITKLLALGSVPSAFITVMILNNFHAEAQSLAKITTYFLGIALILTAMAILFRDKIANFAKTHVTSLNKHPEKYTILVGIILGILVTISSVGAGALGVVALFFLYPKLPAVKIVGTDIAHAVLLTGVAGLGHFYLGTIDFKLLAMLLVGSLPGIWLGSHLASKIPEIILRPMLALMLVVLGGRLVY